MPECPNLFGIFCSAQALLHGTTELIHAVHLVLAHRMLGAGLRQSL